MAISSWWDADPSERFWMEITDRDDLGADLKAPKLDGSGREYWSYSLVEYVEEGDVVFHWWKPPGEEPALVGWSRAVGTVETSTIRWLAHGTVGRARGEARTQPSWRMPLEDFQQFETPISLGELRAIEGRLQAVGEQLRTSYGDPLYLPFNFSEKRPLRPAQGYLVKFPRAYMAELPELAGLFEIEPRQDRARPTPVPKDRRQADPVVRRAVEKYAVRAAQRLLEGEGWTTADVGDSRPYDVEAVRGEEVLHVEAKGSGTRAIAIELTSGEVDHADTTPTMLIVVDEIDWVYVASEVQCSGGRTRLWREWVPESDRLVPTRYRYTLPEAD
jgi:hypothetical protein